jgi:hypothetical protein
MALCGRGSAARAGFWGRRVGVNGCHVDNDPQASPTPAFAAKPLGVSPPACACVGACVRGGERPGGAAWCCREHRGGQCCSFVREAGERTWGGGVAVCAWQGDECLPGLPRPRQAHAAWSATIDRAV